MTAPIPVELPVPHLSVSSINLLRRCPEKWRRRYIAGEYEPPAAPMIVGKAAGYALVEQNFGQKIGTGTDLPVADIADAYSDSFDHSAADGDVDWGGHKPGAIKDAGLGAVRHYRETLAPAVVPVTVERRVRVDFDGLRWGFIGYLDWEDRDGAVSDLKLSGQRKRQQDADSDPQAAAYLMARRAEGKPAPEFRFHVATRSRKPSAEVVVTHRTDAQLDVYLRRVFAAAREIRWRAENDAWDGAPPGAWWCSPTACGYWPVCPYGGG